MITRLSLYISSSFRSSNINFIHTSGLYCINSGYIETYVQDSNYNFDTLIMKHNGDINYNSITATIKLGLFNSTIDTSLNYMALPCDILWEIESGNLRLNNQLKVLPGSKIEIKEGATLTANSNLMIYTTFNDTCTTYPYPSLAAGEFICNGTFVAATGFAGLVKSTMQGATIQVGGNAITTLSCNEIVSASGTLTYTVTTQTINETARGIIGGIETNLNNSTTYSWNGSEYVVV